MTEDFFIGVLLGICFGAWVMTLALPAFNRRRRRKTPFKG